MIRTVLSAIVLALAPLAASAACSGHEEQAMSCAQDMVWNPETSVCEPIVTG